MSELQNGQESKTDSTTTTTSGYQATPQTPPPVEPEVDDFGYETTPPAPEVDPEPPKKDDDPTPPEGGEGEPKKETEDDPKVEKKVSGYGNKEDEPEGDPEPPKKEDESDPEPNTEELKTKLKEAVDKLPEGFDKEGVQAFAEENKWTPEQTEAYVNMTIKQAEEAKTANEVRVKEQRSQWQEELKSDKDFGGENFDKNVDRVEKVLEKFFPSTKKVLTDKGGMLPPYVMKDLLSLDKSVINPTNKLIGGEPPEPEESQDDFLDQMYK